ncbi:MAG: hypothetical protein SOW22_01760 [Candidatus Egerieousia sp.]|nr:hypothetical protein [Candidatus Egerieousia sp.]
MKRNIIEMTEHGIVTIPSEAIWLSEAELVALFGVIAPTIRAAIKAVYKGGILKEYQAQRYIHLSDKVGIDVYSLEMVTALAFRINSYGAEQVRHALLSRIHRRKEKASLLLSLNFNGIGNPKYLA